MKKFITFLSLVLSLNLWASENPSNLSLWGSLPPSVAQPGDNIYFLSVATGGSDLEYRFIYSDNYGANWYLLKDWGPQNFANATLPTDFETVTYMVECRGVGQTGGLNTTQVYTYKKDIELLQTEVEAGETFTILHPRFQLGQYYTVQFTNISGYNDFTSAFVQQQGRLEAPAPNYNGTVNVFVQGIITRIRPKIKILPNTNLRPVAAIQANTTQGYAPLAVHFDASTSQDPDGTITSYLWDFGNGQTATGMTVNYTFTNVGNYNVTLTVTDNGGKTDTETMLIIVTETPNLPPVAEFSFEQITQVAPFQVNFDASTSSDPDGSIVSYEWDFGDFQNGTGVNPNHGFNSKGKYNVSLKVTDNLGAFTTKTIEVQVTGPNVLPVASISLVPDFFPFFSTSPLKAFGSYDPDGQIVSYKWEMDDFLILESTVSEETFRPAFPGTMMLKLTVTDNEGGQALAQKRVFMGGAGNDLENLGFSEGEFLPWYKAGGVVEAIEQCNLEEVTRSTLNRKLARSHTQYVWRKPTFKRCEDNLYAAVITNSGPDTSKTMLTQYFTGNAYKLRGKMILLSNEDVITPRYKDKFKVYVKNFIGKTLLIEMTFDQVVWGPGVIGFESATAPMSFEIDLNSYVGQAMTLDFVVEDDGDALIDSGMAIYDLEKVYE